MVMTLPPLVINGAAFFNQRNQREGANLQCQPEPVPAGIRKPARQVFPVGEGDTVDQKGNVSKRFSGPVKHFDDLVVFPSVAGQGDGAVQGVGQTDHPVLQPVILVGERQLGPGFGQDLGDGPSDAAVVGDAENDALLA